MINDLESTFLDFLINTFGIRWAISIEDLLMILFASLFGYMIGQYRLVRIGIKRQIRFSSRLKHLVFQRNKHEDITEYSFKIPKTRIEIIQFIIGIHLIRRKQAKLELSKAKKYALLSLAFIIFLILCFVISIAFAIHVINPLLIYE